MSELLEIVNNKLADKFGDAIYLENTSLRLSTIYSEESIFKRNTYFFKKGLRN